MARSYLSHEHPLRFAHRGSRVLWPENTMPAFQGAVDLGYRYIETDVHVTRDGRVVVFHDDDLSRLTNGSGKVWEWPWADLRHLDAGHTFGPDEGFPWRDRGVGIPLLEDVLATFADRSFNIDLKQAGIEAAVAAEIDRLGAQDRVMIGSFFDRRIRRFRRVTAGRVATSAGPLEVAGALTAARLGRPAAGPADAYQVPERARGLVVASARFVAAAHAAGKHVHVWTVNDAGSMHRLLDLGVDGIITDRPDILNEVLAEREAPE